MNYFLCFLSSLMLSLALTPLVRNLGIKIKKLYRSSAERWRRRSVSKGGGIAIFAAFLVPVVMFLPMDRTSLAILAGAAIIFSLGLIDDFRNIKPHVKLIGQLIAASLVVSSGSAAGSVHQTLGPFSYILLIVWIVGITNAFNLLDNMDGLAAGVAFIASSFLFIYGILTNGQNQPPLYLTLALSGASLGFLRYNFRPAKIYMGDCGSLLLGYMISVCSVANAPAMAANLFLILLVPALILAVPIFDTIFVMILRRSNRIPIFQGGSDHTSHRVVKLGLSEKKAVLLFYAISASFGALGMMTVKISLPYVHIFIILSVIALVMFGLFLGKIPVYQSHNNGILIKKKPVSRNGAVLNTVLLHKRRFLEVLIDFFLIFAAYISAFSLLYDFNYSVFADIVVRSFPVLVIVKLLTFMSMKLYRGIWRYLGLNDLVGIFKATVLSSALSAFFVKIVFGFDGISGRVFIVDWMVLFLLMEIVRGLERTFGLFFESYRPKRKEVLIFGAGDAGAMVLKEIRNDENLSCKVAGFLDDDRRKKGKRIDGIHILGGREEISGLVKKKHIDEVIVAVSDMRQEEFEELAKICEGSNVDCRKMNRLVS